MCMDPLVSLIEKKLFRAQKCITQTAASQTRERTAAITDPVRVDPIGAARA
jgi:hypothetical protein